MCATRATISSKNDTCVSVARSSRPARSEATLSFQATILHPLGIGHTLLTFYHNGIRRRLTDVHGKVSRA
jgi:hypothetical protein